MENRIKYFCCGNKLNDLEQKLLFEESVKLTKLNKTTNSGKLSEWYVQTVLEDNNINFFTQFKIQYGNAKRYLIVDMYIPSLDLLIEVKSRSYNMTGTANEKLDYVSRKYEILKSTNNYKNSKLLIVCCADELNQESTKELINPTREITKKFLNLYKEHGNLIGYISVVDLYKYISS